MSSAGAGRDDAGWPRWRRQPAAEGDVRPVAPGVVAPVDALTTGAPGRSSDAESSGCQLVDTASRRDIATGVV
jgi:hypothetical protein